MNRITNTIYDFVSTGSGQSWICPAGVTVICITLGDRLDPSTFKSATYILNVVPNTTYIFTINQTGYTSYNNANTMGSIFSWAGANRMYLEWVE